MTASALEIPLATEVEDTSHKIRSEAVRKTAMKSTFSETVSKVDRKDQQLLRLKEELGPNLRASHQVCPPPGVPTGLPELDQHLLWKGFPRGDLTLLTGLPGTGATSLWAQAVSLLSHKKRWSAWIGFDEVPYPFTLEQMGVDLKYFWAVQPEASNERLFWTLQELLSAELFELVLCDLPSKSFTQRQWKKLKIQARQANVALVFTERKPPSNSLLPNIFSRNTKLRDHHFALCIELHPQHLTVRRALHRPSQSFAKNNLFRRSLHAHLMPQSSPENTHRLARSLSSLQPEDSSQSA